MPFNIGAPELILILIIALIVVGPGKLPDVGAALGRGIREFRKAASDVKDAADPTPTPAIPVARAEAPPPAAPSAQTEAGSSDGPSEEPRA